MFTRQATKLPSIASRNLSTSAAAYAAPLQSRGLVYSENGEPQKVIRAATWDIEPPRKGQALLRMGLSSLNPADFNVIQGVYPAKPAKRSLSSQSEPCYVGGNEGFARVEQLNGDSTSSAAGSSAIKEGDWVVFAKPQMGTWCDQMVCDIKDLVKIPRSENSSLTQVMASTLMINPATARCMLNDFETVKEGDIVIQNAANSAVGQNVIQMAARKMGAETVNLIRDRPKPELDSLQAELQRLGKGGLGTHVFTYEELADRTSGARQRIKEILAGRSIRLGLNAVCGAAATNMAKVMGSPSTLVTYGAMSKSPLALPASLQIFSDLSARGFWQTRWYAQKSPAEREALIAELTSWFEDGSLEPPKHEIIEMGGLNETDAQITSKAQESVGRAMNSAGTKSFLRFGSGLGPAAPSAPVAAGARGFHAWQAPPSGGRKSAPVLESTNQVNPGLPPAPEQIGVDAVLRQNPNDPDSHTTTIFSEFSLYGKTAVISGGNGGLGLEIALAYVEAGANVYAIDLPKEPSEEFKIVAEHCRIMDKGLHYISATVTDHEDMYRVMEHIREESGRLDICVAAAGILQTYDALEYPREAFDKVFAVNTTGVFLTAQAAAREMHKQDGVKGSIILIASMSGSIVNRDHHWVAYNASKSAVLQMARSLAAEWGPKDIRVNSLSPGHIRTRMTAAYLDENPHLLSKWSTSNPLGRIGRSGEIRGVSVWLASEASSFCTGSDIVVSGGHQIW